MIGGPAGAGAAAGGPPGAPPPALPGLMLPQARLPQPTVFDGTTPPFQEWIQETRNFLSINNYEFVRQMDYSLQSDTEITIQDVTISTTRGGERREALDRNEEGQDALNRELALRLGEQREGRTDEVINQELTDLRTDHDRLQRLYDEQEDRVVRGGDYLNYVLKLGTEANNYTRRLQRSTHGFEALRLLRLRYSGEQMLQNYQLLRELLNPKFTESQQHYQYRQWLETLSRYELEARQPLDDNLKIATLVNGLRGNLQQHLLLSVKPTCTWQNVREIVENYYTSTFVPNPTTGHIAYLAHGSLEEQVNYIKGRRKGKGKGGKGKKGGDHYKGKGKSKEKGKQGDYNKGKGKGYNKGGKGYQGWNSWNQGGSRNYNNNNNGQGRGKGKGGKSNATTQCHVCKKFGHVAANCWHKDSTYTTAAVGSGTTGQTQHFSIDHPHPSNDQPVALMPRDQLPLYNQHRQCISGSYMQSTTAPRAATSSTASYITTPAPILHDISHVYCEEIDDYKRNVLEINYNQQLTNGMNPDYARDLPAHYLKHWGHLDTGAYVSVAPKHFAPEALLEPVLHPVQLLTATSTPIKIYGTKTVLLVSGRLSFHVRFYIIDVKQTLLGLQDILQGDIQLNLRDTYTSTIQKGDVEEPLLFHDKHFYVEALVLEQDHKVNYLWLHYLQSNLFRTTTTVYYTTGDGEVHEQAGEAQLPRSSKPPQLPTEEERRLHELTHQPYRNWREVCQLAKGRPAYHKRQPRDKESVIQMNYGFLQDPHLPPGSPQQRPLTVLTMLETTTGLSNAILTTRKGDTTHQ